MRQLSEIEIYLLDRNPQMCAAWKSYVPEKPNIKIVCTDFVSFMKMYKVDCVVSPANSYGLMDGGYDRAISDWFGDGLSQKVRTAIIDKFLGEQPLCSSLMIDTDYNGVKLIHTPSMRVPSIIKDVEIVYHCTRSCLLCALNSDVKSVVVPAFGGLTGCVSAQSVGKMMGAAIAQLDRPPQKIDWEYASRHLTGKNN